MPQFTGQIGGHDVDELFTLLRDLGIDLGPLSPQTPWVRLSVVPLLTLRRTIEDAATWEEISPACEAFMDTVQKVADWVRSCDPRDGMAIGLGEPLLANPRTYTT